MSVSVAVQESKADPLVGWLLLLEPLVNAAESSSSENNTVYIVWRMSSFILLLTVGGSGVVFSGWCLRVVDGDR